MNLSPAAFIHFGTTRELISFMSEEVEGYSALGWRRMVGTNREGGEFAASGSSLHPGARVGAGSYIEDSLLGAGTAVGRGSVVSSATLSGETVPDFTALHVVKLSDGRFSARLYGANDNPKEAVFLGRPIARLLEKVNLPPEAIWDGPERTLWTAKLFPVRNTALDAARAALELVAEPRLTAELRPVGDLKLPNRLPEGERISLKEGFERADGQAILDWQDALDERIRIDRLLTLIEARRPAQEAAGIFAGHEPTNRQIERLIRKVGALPVAEGDIPSAAVRAQHFLGKLCPSKRAQFEGEAFRLIRDAIHRESVKRLKFDEALSIQKDKSAAHLPLRVNFGGGWSDTPPYCNENGGTVLNAAIRVGGRSAGGGADRAHPGADARLRQRRFGRLRRIHRHCGKALDCSNPFDPFALHKATLMASGILPADGRPAAGRNPAPPGRRVQAVHPGEGHPQGVRAGHVAASSRARASRPSATSSASK